MVRRYDHRQASSMMMMMMICFPEACNAEVIASWLIFSDIYPCC